MKDCPGTVRARIGTTLSPAAKILFHSVPRPYFAETDTETGVRTRTIETFNCKFSWYLYLAEHSREVQKASAQTNSLARSVRKRADVWLEHLQFVGLLADPRTLDALRESAGLSFCRIMDVWNVDVVDAEILDVDVLVRLNTGDLPT